MAGGDHPRDLEVLAGRRLLKRVHGRAVFPLGRWPSSPVSSFAVRWILAQKHRIAGAAANELHGAAVYLQDEGSPPPDRRGARRPEPDRGDRVLAAERWRTAAP